jgi:hypothetical protein
MTRIILHGLSKLKIIAGCAVFISLGIHVSKILDI